MILVGNPLTPTNISPLISQGQWAFLFRGLPVRCSVGASTLAPLLRHSSEHFCRKIFGELVGLECLWAGLWCQRKENA